MLRVAHAMKVTHAQPTPSSRAIRIRINGPNYRLRARGQSLRFGFLAVVDAFGGLAFSSRRLVVVSANELTGGIEAKGILSREKELHAPNFFLHPRIVLMKRISHRAFSIFELERAPPHSIPDVLNGSAVRERLKLVLPSILRNRPNGSESERQSQQANTDFPPSRHE
jgi:hypothetical protein